MGHLQKAAACQRQKIKNKIKFRKALIVKSGSPPSSIRKILFFFRIIWASCPGNMKNWTQDSGSKLNKKQNCLLILKTHFHSLGAVIPTFAQKHTTIPKTLNSPCPIKWHHLNTSYFILSILEQGIDCPYKKSFGVPWDNWPCPQEEITAQRGAELSVPNHQIPAQSGSQVQILYSDWSSELGSSWHECTADCRSQSRQHSPPRLPRQQPKTRWQELQSRDTRLIKGDGHSHITGSFSRAVITAWAGLALPHLVQSNFTVTFPSHPLSLQTLTGSYKDFREMFPNVWELKMRNL